MASRQRMGLVWPSAMETHCSGAVLAPLAPPTGVMTPLPRREGERVHLSARESEARPSEICRSEGDRTDRGLGRMKATLRLKLNAVDPLMSESWGQPVGAGRAGLDENLSVTALSTPRGASRGQEGGDMDTAQGDLPSDACLTQILRPKCVQAPEARGLDRGCTLLQLTQVAARGAGCDGA